MIEVITDVMFILIGISGIVIITFMLVFGIVGLKAMGESGEDILKIKKDITEIKEKLEVQAEDIK